MSTVIDWSVKPEPWQWIGPQFRAECEAIASDVISIGGTTIRDRRRALGLSATQLAVIAGYPGCSTVYGVESGVKGPAAERILAALARLEAERGP